MPTEIVRIETVLYSCTDNVTFITDQTGSFNCNVCVQAARSRLLMNCPRTQRVVCLALMSVTELVMCGLLVSHSLNQAQDIQVPY